jgi:hypothetical protein
MAHLVRKSLTIDPEALRRLADAWGTSESEAVCKAVDAALGAEEIVGAMQALHEMGAFSGKAGRGKRNRSSARAPIKDSKFVGMWRDRDDLTDSSEWVRTVRKPEQSELHS